MGTLDYVLQRTDAILVRKPEFAKSSALLFGFAAIALLVAMGHIISELTASA